MEGVDLYGVCSECQQHWAKPRDLCELKVPSVFKCRTTAWIPYCREEKPIFSKRRIDKEGNSEHVKKNEQAEPVGRLYKGDCKLVINSTNDIPGSWIMIGLHNKIGYIQKNEYIRLMNCSGTPSVDEIVYQPSTLVNGNSTSPATEYSRPSTADITSQIQVTDPRHLETATTSSIPQGHLELCPDHVKNDASLNGGFLGQFGQFCYEFVNWKRAFDGAESHCRVKSGTLVSITNQQEQNFIEQFLTKHNVVECWIGLNDKQSEGVLTWTTGDPVTYTHFQTGFNLHAAGTHKNNDCFVIQNSGEWVDTPCGLAISIINLGESHPFICQYNISAKISTFLDILPDISVG